MQNKNVFELKVSLRTKIVQYKNLKKYVKQNLVVWKKMITLELIVFQMINKYANYDWCTNMKFILKVYF